jgi:hypothetical protein
MPAQIPIIVPVGGFLGAGKTTLLVTAARTLLRRGLKPALILNDQGDDLVDTNWAKLQELAAADVTGGCFCCRFSDFLDAAESLAGADVIFAEPTGSCTDLAATVMQPLRNEFVNRFRLSPLTVVVDPSSIDRLRADPDTRFLFENQCAEADLVCFTRSDVCDDVPALPGIVARRLSGLTGEGVALWLDEVLAGNVPAGEHVLDVDYERYAAAEAALGWLNCSVHYRPKPALSPPMMVGRLLDELDSAMTQADVRIVHLKVLDRSSSGALKAAITANGQEPVTEGDLSASPSAEHELLINLRAIGEPELLESIVRRALPAGAQITKMQAFRPGPPVKNHA